MCQLASSYLNNRANPPHTDAQWLRNAFDLVRQAGPGRQGAISTQSAVLIESHPDLREHLPPGADDLLQKVENIAK